MLVTTPVAGEKRKGEGALTLNKQLNELKDIFSSPCDQSKLGIYLCSFNLVSIVYFLKCSFNCAFN